MSKKEEKAREYADNEVRRYHEHSGIIERYGMERARMTSEHEATELEEAFKAGWQAAIEYLHTLPVREVVGEICKESKGGK